MKKQINSGVWFFIASACFYLSTVISFFTKHEFDVMFFCLGSSMLCLGYAEMTKAKKKDESNDDENNENYKN